jgi:glutathione S-transferase
MARMKLYYAPTSPYVRKVLACAITRGLDGRIQLQAANPHASPADLVADNPTSKVPCLVTDDGMSLYDSPVICEFLDSLGDAPALFPALGAARWRALKFQAMGDGILDAAVPCRGELLRPKEAARDAAMARHKAVMSRTVDALEAMPPHLHVDIGSIAVGCALGYMDFRFASDPWRPGHPKLTAWFEAFSANPGLAQTIPRE